MPGVPGVLDDPSNGSAPDFMDAVPGPMTGALRSMRPVEYCRIRFKENELLTLACSASQSRRSCGKNGHAGRYTTVYEKARAARSERLRPPWLTS